ncbi:MAG: hypothetical protein JWR82_2178, partial [Blastococcus sp.]|nr:hypothetical protein [Blastococcus sp.]
DMASFDQVKTDFGGRLVRYPEAVELIASPLVRWAYDLARRSTAGSRLVETAKRMARAGAGLRPRPRADRAAQLSS